MTERYKILFVCAGNICRSPAAEGIMLKKLKEQDLLKYFYIDSAGILNYHEGELPDFRMCQHVEKRGYKLESRSRPVKRDDFSFFDLILYMDDSNRKGLEKFRPTAEERKKIKPVTDYCVKFDEDEVPDPYYGGSSGFEYVLDMLENACECLIEKLVMSQID
jgi:protein-tyrosine phosphatase